MPFPSRRSFVLAPRRLGRAGWLVLLGGTIGLGSMWGCRPGPPRRPLQDQDPVFVIPAIKEAAVEEQRQDIPRLIELLTSEDSAVRLYASQALQNLTGENFGYAFWRDPASQTESILRWQRWAADQGLIRAEDLPAVPTSEAPAAPLR